MLSAQALLQKHPDLEVWQGTPTNDLLQRASATESCAPGDLTFASQQSQLNEAVARKASVIIASAKLSLPETSSSLILKTKNVGLMMSRVLPDFAPKRFTADGSYHPQSFIHPSAKLGENVTIGPFVSIAEDVVIGEGTYIGPNTVIERGAQIGKNCRFHALVFIGAHCEVGDDCEFHAHVTIGSDGFGYAQDANFNHHKLPQIGKVVIGDRVEIGANTAIDRAAFRETRIGSGTKIDNLCHIAHNCVIGENSVLAGGIMIAGSSEIGARFMGAGSSVIADHVKIAEGVILAGRSAVTNDITQSGAYGGYPVQPMKDHLRTVASFPHLVRLRKQVSRIMKHLNLSEEENP